MLASSLPLVHGKGVPRREEYMLGSKSDSDKAEAYQKLEKPQLDVGGSAMKLAGMGNFLGSSIYWRSEVR